jgi:hypothetical protein
MFFPQQGVVLMVLSGAELELELDQIQTQITQKPMLRADIGYPVRCANKESVE